MGTALQRGQGSVGSVPCLGIYPECTVSNSQRDMLECWPGRILHSNGQIPVPCGSEVQEDEGVQRYREVSSMKTHIVGCFLLTRTGTKVASAG